MSGFADPILRRAGVSVPGLRHQLASLCPSRPELVASAGWADYIFGEGSFRSLDGKRRQATDALQFAAC
eukprot:12950474-Alexandrium_andersonii.AAC.1